MNPSWLLAFSACPVAPVCPVLPVSVAPELEKRVALLAPVLLLPAVLLLLEFAPWFCPVDVIAVELLELLAKPVRETKN